MSDQLDELLRDVPALTAPGWQQFPEESGSLNVPRASMPQIKSTHRGAMVQYLKGRGITHSREEIAPNLLRPSQAEFSPAKVEKALGFEGKSRSILVSSDGYVVDGHHQWLAALNSAPDTPIPVIRLNAPIQQTLIEAARFPSSGVDEASTAAARAAGEAVSGSPRALVDDGKPLHEFLAELTGHPPPAPTVNQPSLLRRAASTAVDVVQLPKAKAGFDLSATSRQGLAQIMAHPTYFPRAMREQVRAFASEDAFNSFVESIKSRPDFQLLRENVDLSSVGDIREEVFASGLARKIPGVRASDRAYSAALDSIKALNVPFFSPRNTAAKFNLLSPARVVRNALDPATRPVAWLQMRDASRGLAVFSTTLGLLYYAGLDITLNPYSSDFGKLRVGRAVYDLTGGEGATVRYLAKMSRSFFDIEKGSKPKQTPLALTARYLRSQLQPAASVAVDKATGKTFEGKDFTYSQAAADLAVPFIVSDVYSGWVDAGGSTVAELTQSVGSNNYQGLSTASVICRPLR
jgi:hypothetical protein